MPQSRESRKTNWKDVGELRRPNGRWQLGNAASYFAEVLGLPPDAIAFVRPDGSGAQEKDTLGSLRSDWAAAQ